MQAEKQKKKILMKAKPGVKGYDQLLGNLTDYVTNHTLESFKLNREYEKEMSKRKRRKYVAIEEET